MPPVQHKMLQKDLSTDTGICARCGPVRLAWKQSAQGRSPRCENGLRESKSSPGRHRSETSGWRNARRPHGLTKDEAEMFRAGKSCAICGSTERLCVDHCHDSGVIRGVLCRDCNIALGMFRDKVPLLAMAVVYLSQDRAGTIQGPIALAEGMAHG